MSLADKYKQSVIKDNLQETSRQLFQNTVNMYYEEYGLDPTIYFEPIKMTSGAARIIGEAIALIEHDKWHQARLNVSKADVIEERSFLTLVPKSNYYTDSDPKYIGGPYVKYKWDDGSVHFSQIKSEMICVNSGKYFKKSKMVREMNIKLQKLSHYLFGSQKYVILTFNCGTWDDRGERYNYLVLFEDGYLFRLRESFTSVYIDDYTISTEYGDYRVSLDEWLISNIKRINK